MMTWLARLRRPRCPPGWKLTRAIDEAIDPQIEWHVMRCHHCFAEYQALQALAEHAKATLPGTDKMSRETRDAIGARLRTLASAAGPHGRGPPDRRALVWLALLLPATAAAIIVVGRRADDSASARRSSEPAAITTAESLAKTRAETRAKIRAIGPARFARAQVQPDEIVRVDDGEIELEIEPLHAGERFRVVTNDGEVEVRGTSFKVSATNGALAAVHVWRGRVEVRSRGGALAVLEAGDDWVRTETPAAATLKKETAAALSPPPPPAAKFHTKKIAAALPEPKPLPATRDDRPVVSAASFGHAWSLLRAGDAKRAAAEFAEVERLARGRDIEEDALYWRAVAVDRTGDATGARQLFGWFLDRFPSSSRAGEAAAALGRLLLASGERGAARRAFERAALDPSPQVQASARDGLRRTQEEDP